MQTTDNSCRTILVVDDDEIQRILIRAVLESEGFRVVDAADGEAACRICGEEPLDLLISDVAMPGMDGFDLCRELRRRPETAHLPILMATGLDDSASITRAYDCGATDFIAKPLNLTILSHRIRYMLRAAQAFAELRSSQRTLMAAKEAAESANQTKTKFLAVVSHELRTPLNAIIGFAALMRDQVKGPMPEAYEEYPAIIAESGEHLLGVINSVLDIAKAESDRLTLDVGPVDLVSVAEHIRRIFEDPARTACVEFDVEVAESLGPLRADEHKIRQILINLLSNSIKFTPKGGRVSLRIDQERCGAVVFEVSDTGIGMSSEQIATALTPFGQVDNGLSRQYNGIGLGLPLCKNMIELHNGTLSIESVPQRGTTVTVMMPGRA